MPIPEETTHWKGSPSQWLNIGPFTIAIVISIGIIVAAVFFPLALIALILPLIYAVWSFLTVRCHIFELTTQRLRISTGVINQNIDEVELYRIKDILVERIWWMRLLGLGSVHLETSDRSLPKIEIPAIPNSIEFREDFRKLVETMRDSKRVREMDFDDTQDSVSFS